MRTISILSIVAIATGAKIPIPIIPGCPCLPNSCRPDSNCRIALARMKRESDIPLNRLDKRLLRDYGIGECLNCNSVESNAVPVEPFVEPVPQPPVEPLVVYRPQPVVEAIPQYVLRKPAVATRRPELVVPKTVGIPVQYMNQPTIQPQRVVQVVQPKVVRTITVPIKATRCQERQLNAAARKAAQGLEYADPCPLCQSCGQQIVPPPTQYQPTLIRRTTTTETDTAPVPVIDVAPTREE